MSDTNDMSLTPTGTSRFATTHWSVVLAAGDSASPEHREALSTLCQQYWFPLYAYLRRRGNDRHQAEDLTQAFFVQMLDKRRLRGISTKPGKFRSFLLASLKNFVANEIDRVRAQKRGGSHTTLSLDFGNAERQYISEPTHQMSPEKLFEKSWALTVLEHTMNELKAEFAKSNKLRLFGHLRIYLTAETDTIPYRDVAIQMKMTEEAVKMAVYRLRTRYRELLREKVAQTVATQEQIEEEIRYMLAVLSS